MRWSLNVSHSTLYLTALIPPKIAIITKSRNVLKKSKVLYFKAEHAGNFFLNYNYAYLFKFFQQLCDISGYGVFNATFNNISIISWWSVLLVEDTQSTWRKPLISRKSLIWQFLSILSKITQIFFFMEWSPFQNFIQHCYHPSKLKTITKYRLFFKWSELLHLRQNWHKL